MRGLELRGRALGPVVDVGAEALEQVEHRFLPLAEMNVLNFPGWSKESDLSDGAELGPPDLRG